MCGLSATRSKVPHHTYTWWGPHLESVQATSRILTPLGVGWWGCLRCSYYRYYYWPDSVFLLSCIPVMHTVMLASGTWCVKQSTTPHTWWGPPLESVGATSRIPHYGVLSWWSHPQCTCYSESVRDIFNNLIMVTSGTLSIWSFSRSDNGTRMSCPDRFGWSTGSGMNCQW